MRSIFDVDIDTTSKTDKKQYGIPAMIYNEDQERINPHPSGVYLEEVPIDKLTGLCSFDYKYGDEKGFMKVDILHNTVYDIFKSKKEVLEASENDIDWSILEDRKVVESLPHIAKHYDIIQKLKPKSVEDLADVLALIRPGKSNLIDSYIQNKEQTRRNLYKRPKTGMYFKKSHAISYALMIKTLIYKKHQAMICW
jgi:hypothetical protein